MKSYKKTVIAILLAVVLCSMACKEKNYVWKE